MSSEFTTEKPKEVGLWEFACGETNDKPEKCAITALQFFTGEPQLIVHDEHLGTVPLDTFHGGLTGIRWRKIA